MNKDPSFSFKGCYDNNNNNQNINNTKNNENANKSKKETITNISSDMPDYFNNQGNSPKFNVSNNNIPDDLSDIPISEMDFKKTIKQENDKITNIYNTNKSCNNQVNNNQYHAPGVSKDDDKTSYIQIDNIINNKNSSNNTNNNNLQKNKILDKNKLYASNTNNQTKVLSNNAVYKSKDEIERPKKSHLEYLKIIKENKDPIGIKASGGLKEISLEELSKHNKPNDMWMAINNEVYDLTMYLDYHPGGFNKLMEGAGQDGTELFYDNHPWVNIHNLVGKLQIGYLKK